MPGKGQKTVKNAIAKKPTKSRRIVDKVPKAKPVKRKALKKKIEKKPIKKVIKKVIKKGKKSKKSGTKQKTTNLPGQITEYPSIIPPNLIAESAPIVPPNPINESAPIIPPNPIAESVPDVQLVQSISSSHFLATIPKTNILIILFFLSIILFFVGGYFFPATPGDMASNNVIWASNDGKYDRGLFSQFFASIAFTFGVILLGYYVNVTFIKFNIKYWNYFLIGILLMFFFGLGKIGELTFNHNIFEGFKNLILPVALIIMAFASYKIYKHMVGRI